MSSVLRRKCIDVLHDYSGIAITEEQFLELMTENPDLEKQLIKYNSPSDTADREYMMERLAIKIVGRPWPCYGDGKEAAQKFYADLERMAVEKGYALVK
jgi:hypothetical protein